MGGEEEKKKRRGAAEAVGEKACRLSAQATFVLQPIWQPTAPATLVAGFPDS